MASASKGPGTDSDAGDKVLEAVREARPEPADEDLNEHRPDDDSPQELQQPLHNPWWAGGGATGGV